MMDLMDHHVDMDCSVNETGSQDNELNIDFNLTCILIGSQTAIFLSFFLSFFFLTFSGLTPCGIWDLSSPTRDGTCAPALGVQSLNHWTSREVLPRLLF